MLDALDGALVLYLLVAGGLTLVVGALALTIFKRAVARHMQAADGGPAELSDSASNYPRRPAETPLDIRIVSAATASAGEDPSARSLRQLVATHACAGLVFGMTGAVLLLVLGEMEMVPLRLAVVAVALAWPTIIALCILVGPDWKLQSEIFLGYGMLILVLCVTAWARGVPDLTLGPEGQTVDPDHGYLTLPGYMQPGFIWALYAAPSLFLLLFLNRTVRTIGPLVLVFFFIMLLGSHLSISLLTIPGVMSLAVEVALALGFGGVTVFWGFLVLGLIAGALAGWLAARSLVQLYAAKRISDLTLVIGAIWLLQTLVLANSFVREQGALGLAAAILPMAGWAIIVAGGQRLMTAQSTVRPARHLLLLRVFGFGRRSRRLLDLLAPRWRLLGSIHLIAAPDLAPRAIEPSTFLEFVRGRLQDLFLRTPVDLDRKLQSLDRLPDLDGRFRTNQIYCSGEIWKSAVMQLMQEASLVAMDLRGFGLARRGCVFELQILLDTVPLTRLVLLIDRSTDLAALKQLLLERWHALDAASQNHLLQPAHLLVLDAADTNLAVVLHLLAIAGGGHEASSEPVSVLTAS